MELDAPPLKRSRDTSSSTQPYDFANLHEFAQRVQTANVPMPRNPEPARASSGDSFPASATWKRCTRDNTVASQRRSHPFDATVSKFPVEETPPVTPRVENSKFAKSASSFLSFSVPVQHPMSPAHAHVPTRIDESDRESAINKQSDDPFQFDDPPVTAAKIWV